LHGFSTSGLLRLIVPSSCTEAEFNKDNQWGAEQQDGEVIQYYIGPYCSPTDGYSIHLGIFSDPYCSRQVDSSVYTDYLKYEFELPYSTSALVDGSCTDCSKVDANQNSNNNNNDAPEVSETCEAMYNYAAKCEQKMEIDSAYQDNTGCEFLNVILPRVNTANKSFAAISSKDNSGCESIVPSQAEVSTNLKTENATIGSDESFVEKCDPQAYAVVFGVAVTFGITTVVLLAAHAYLMQNKDNARKLTELKSKEAPEIYSGEVSI
jgi:hypothetical protein